MPCQVDVSKSQGKRVSGEPAIHYACEVFSNFLCKDGCRIPDITVMNAEVRKMLWIDILNRNYGTGYAAPVAKALGGTADTRN